MATYIYETIPADRSTPPRRFEVRQSMKDAALTHDPETGEPVHRVITGGLGYVGSSKGDANAMPSKGAGGGCGHAGCGCGHAH